MSTVVEVLDQFIIAAESVDHWLHDKIDKLKELRQKLTTFGAAELDGDEERLCGMLRAIGAKADGAE